MNKIIKRNSECLSNLNHFDKEKYHNTLLFIPLGGSDEIGMNVNLYHFHGKWIMIDCGSGFADDTLPGVDLLVADLTFIQKHKKDLLGIILTHAHEDHIGAVQYLWNLLECPIYATKFTKNLLTIKLAEYYFDKNPVINEIYPDKKWSLGPFELDTVYLTHSAPEMHAIVITTSKGTILHTGDWKFDNSPLLGGQSNYDKLKEYQKANFLALVCDSTNVFNKTKSVSESVVYDNLLKEVKKSKQLVIITTFASNLARLHGIFEIAKATNRKIALLGLSLARIVRAAKQSGYLASYNDILDAKSIKKTNKKNILVIATGCQGEENAALSKMVDNKHPDVILSKNDKVIFSSKIIPGNEKKIYNLFNKLSKIDIDVITEMHSCVHASGHPNIDELKEMYKLVQPDVLIPVHGEPIHLKEHIKLGKLCGIKNNILVENGSVVNISDTDTKVIGTVQKGYYAVDGNSIIHINSDIFNIRKKISKSGIILITLVLDKDYNLVSTPIISTPGLMDSKQNSALIQFIIDQIIFNMESSIEINSEKHIIKLVKTSVMKTIKEELNKVSEVIVHISNV